MRILFRTAGFLAVICAASFAAADQTQPSISFNRDIRPLLSNVCFQCHGPDAETREAGLRLDQEDEAKSYAIVPGDPDGSEFVARITSEDPELRMPPPDSGKELTADDIKLLTRWVSDGARYQTHWAYVPPTADRVPEVDASGWAANWIDPFLLKAFGEQKLSPTDDADPITLVRRLAFDLTGLPPSRRQIESYAQDPTRSSYARLVDELLASPAFGERMAIYWLDLVRYADTVGYHGDQDHNISPYRDYVIASFNQNLPFDEFTREQIAGDLLPDPTTDQLIASGYNRLLQTSHEGGVQPKEYLSIYAADRIRNVSAVWMGATVGCAQCHDHKYDPYSTEDFYSMVAFFADIDEEQHFQVGTNALPTKRPPEMSVLSRWERRLVDQIEDELSSEPEANRREALRAELRRLEQSRRMTMITRSIEPREIRVLPRGNWLDDSGPIVQPSVPAFLPSLNVGDRRATRLDLATWLTDSESGVGGLTARVFVNRCWYLMFGRGISSSLADFGGQGQPPTHPELLDRLAVEFIDSGWDVKQLIRSLAMSRAYRQSSVAATERFKADPENRWFARQSRYRLPAEMVRDNALAVSGLLIRRVGGASVKPSQPVGYYRHLNFPKRAYLPHVDERQYRRGVYVHWQRQFLHPMLKSLDAPSREECTAQRPRSNTPLEALVLLNDPSMVETAIALAARFAGHSASNDSENLSAMFESATSRPPDDLELNALQKLLVDETAYYSEHPDDAEDLLGGLDDLPSSAISEQPVRLAAWTTAARAVLNLYETVVRN